MLLVGHLEMHIRHMHLMLLIDLIGEHIENYLRHSHHKRFIFDNLHSKVHDVI